MNSSTVSTQESTAVSTAGSSPAGVFGNVGRYRWVICSLLFFATTINYMDRQVLGLLAPIMQAKIGWSESQYGLIVAGFQLAYALGLLGLGPLIDRIGTRIGYSVAMAIWSLAAIAHALVRTVLGFGIVRFALGFGEAGNFPAGLKAVAEWFPKKERALAAGIFNSGTNVGATVAPLLVPWVAVHWGWQYGFLLTGASGIPWIVAWLIMYRTPQNHPRVSPGELAYIQSDPIEPTEKIPWAHLIPHRETWAFLIVKFLTDPVWWFFLFWLPKFLATEHHLSMSTLGLPLVVIYNAATVGSIFGGWLAGKFMKMGWSLNRARKTTMLVCAIAVTPIVVVARVQNLWGAVALISLAVAAHQGWAANVFTFPSDVFPRRAVASVVGIGGFGGAIGGMFIAAFTGFLLQLTGSYMAVFAMAGSAYLLSLLILHLLVPRFEPVNMGETTTA